MKTFRKLAAALMAVVVCLNFVACSDDDNNGNGANSTVNPKNVFTNGIPKEVDGMKITKNAQGLVTKIESSNGTIVTFEYPNVATRAELANQHVRMISKYDTGGEQDETFIYEMEIGSNGFVKHCTETEEDGDLETWDFQYTAEGNINYMKRSEGGNEVTTITYKDGDIIKVTEVSEDEDNETPDIYNISYTSATVTTPIENKGCLMLFDATLGIDMDEMEIAYYAGLLGKATKHLPLKIVCESSVGGTDSFTETIDFKWTLNEQKLPTQLSMKSDNYPDSDIISFVW